jgi:hypothetical protein
MRSYAKVRRKPPSGRSDRRNARVLEHPGVGLLWWDAMKATQTNTSDGIESTELDDRDVRALTEYLTVVPEAPGLYTVTSQSGREYTVDVETGACTCKDAEYRDPKGGCKHARRVRYETGERALPASLDREGLPRGFAAHVDETPRVAATDGGIVDAGDEGVILEEEPLPEITRHRESYEQGGARYWRCEGCGSETIYGRDRILHREDCPRAREDA